MRIRVHEVKYQHHSRLMLYVTVYGFDQYLNLIIVLFMKVRIITFLSGLFTKRNKLLLVFTVDVDDPIQSVSQRLRRSPQVWFRLRVELTLASVTHAQMRI